MRGYGRAHQIGSTPLTWGHLPRSKVTHDEVKALLNRLSEAQWEPGCLLLVLSIRAKGGWCPHPAGTSRCVWMKDLLLWCDACLQSNLAS